MGKETPLPLARILPVHTSKSNVLDCNLTKLIAGFII